MAGVLTGVGEKARSSLPLLPVRERRRVLGCVAKVPVGVCRVIEAECARCR